MKIKVFEQDNCGWCVRLHPHITKLAEDSGIPLEFVNITDKWEIADEYQFRSTPTIAIIDDDSVIKKFSIDHSGINGVMTKVRNFVST